MKNDWNKVYKKGGIFEYYDMLRPHPDMSRVIDIFKKNNVRKVLDLGCGLGNNTIPLMESGFDVSGIDISADAIQKFKISLSKIKKNIPLKVGPFEKLPFKTGEFDGIVCVQTLSHGRAKNIEQGAAEILRVLKKGGMVFLTLPGRVAKSEVRYCLVKTATKIDERVYVPNKGSEIGIPHFIFNKEVIRNIFRNFKINEVRRDYLDYYSVILTRKG